MSWWHAWRRRRKCMHHGLDTGTSWIRETAVWDEGVRVYMCSVCERVFIR